MRTQGAGGIDREGREATWRLPMGDPGALGALLRELEPRMLGVALRITRDRDTAQDVVQSAFERAIRHGHRFRGDSRVSTWLHRIVANEALMWLRSHGRRAQAVRPLDSADEAALTDPAEDALQHVERTEHRARLRGALGALSRDERDVLVACSLDGRSYADYGRERGIHPAAVKSRAFRARRKLGALLDAGVSLR